MLKVVALLAVLLFASSANAACAGQMVNGVCVCYSSFGGVNCDVPQLGSCPALDTVDPLNTTHIAEVSNLAIASSMFSFDLLIPSFSQRYVQSAQVGTNASCSFPSTLSNFATAFDSNVCKDKLSFDFGIDELTRCGWGFSAYDPTHTIISGPVTLSVVDNLGSFRGVSLSRTTTSTVTLGVVAPTTVSVTSNVSTVYSAINATYAVTMQVYDMNTNVLTIVITTSVQYPYAFSGFEVVDGVRGVSSSTNPKTSTFGPCDNTGCFQDSTFTFESLTSSCPNVGVNGDYMLSFTYGCQAGVSNCPVSGAPSESVTITLGIDDPCKTYKVDAHISGNLASYDTWPSQATSSIFLLGDTLFFAPVFTSDLPILNVDVQSLDVSFISGLRTVVSLVSGGVVSTIGNNAGYSQPDRSAAGAYFFFNAIGAVGGSSNGAIFDTANPDSIYQFVVDVTFSITYQTVFRKRDTLTENFTLSQKFVMDASKGIKSVEQVADVFDAASSGYKATIAAAPFVFAAAAAAANL